MTTPSQPPVKSPVLDNMVIPVLSKILGCPCCGPKAWAQLMIGWYERHGYDVPPELQGWR